MTDTTSEAKPWWRKLALPLATGFIVGVLGAVLGVELFEARLGPAPETSRVVAGAIGALYLCMAFGVGLGAASPALGAHFLNAEDADELREQRAMLLPSALAMGAWGLAIALLALAGAGLDRAAATLAALALIALGTVAAWRSHRRSDELWALLNGESASLSYGLVAVIGGGWAIAAHGGVVAAPRPLDWLSLFYAASLMAAFIVAGRRGLLRLR